jgi:hypothetical protein
MASYGRTRWRNQKKLLASKRLSQKTLRMREMRRIFWCSPTSVGWSKGSAQISGEQLEWWSGDSWSIDQFKGHPRFRVGFA